MRPDPYQLAIVTTLFTGVVCGEGIWADVREEAAHRLPDSEGITDTGMALARETLKELTREDFMAAWNQVVAFEKLTPKEKAIALLADLAHSVRLALEDRKWHKVLSGQTAPALDDRDAEYHLRALYRIIAANERID